MPTSSAAKAGVYIPKFTPRKEPITSSSARKEVVANINEIEEVQSHEKKESQRKKERAVWLSKPTCRVCIMLVSAVLLGAATVTLTLLLVLLRNTNNSSETYSTNTVTGVTGTISSVGINTTLSTGSSIGLTTFNSTFSSTGIMSTTSASAFNLSGCNRTYSRIGCGMNQTLATFDDISSTAGMIPNCYHGINWINGYYIYRYTYANSSGYNTATVSGNFTLYNIWSLTMTMISTNRSLFKLNSAVAAAAWNDNLTLTVTGYRSNAMIQERNFTLQVYSTTYLNFTGFSALDNATFMSFGGIRNPRVPGNGTHFAMDNLCFGFI